MSDPSGAPGSPHARQPLRFLLLYALAWAGGSIAYVPFLTILLPVWVAALVPPPQAVVWLSAIAFCGAIAASVGHILFGWLSDVTRTRRLWAALGLALSCLLLLFVPLAHSLPGLILIVVLWQLGLNMMLAPLGAWGADCVPDSQKGLLGGLLAFAPGLGALAGVLITIPGIASADGRLAVVALTVAAAVLPALLLGAHAAPSGLATPAAAPQQVGGTRDLGLFNLTNTMPSLVMPWFTLALVPWFGFSGLFLLFAALALVAALLLAGLRTEVVPENRLPA